MEPDPNWQKWALLINEVKEDTGLQQTFKTGTTEDKLRILAERDLSFEKILEMGDDVMMVSAEGTSLVFWIWRLPEDETDNPEES